MTELAVSRAIARAFGEENIESIPTYQQMTDDSTPEESGMFSAFVSKFGVWADPDSEIANG